MNIQQLRYLTALAENETMTAAAAALGVSQPVMSRALRELVEELQTPILRRVGRRLTFTREGEAVLAAARRVITAFDEVGRSATMARGEWTLRIGICYAGFVQLTPILERLMRRFPGLHVKTTNAHGTQDMLQLLRDDAVDLCFGLADKPGKGLVFTPHENLEIVLLSPLGADLPAILKFNDLANTPMISRTPSKERAQLLDNYCIEAGFRPNFVVESDDSSIFINLVKAGIGSCLAWRDVGEATPGLEMRRFSPPRMVQIGFYHARKPTVQIRTLLSLARQMRPDAVEAVCEIPGGDRASPGQPLRVA